METTYKQTEESSISAWCKGYTAYIIGESLSDNPYHESTDKDSYHDFISGFFCAMNCKEA